jgi:hypothetical protein
MVAVLVGAMANMVCGLDPQRRDAFLPFFNAECAVAAHSWPTLKPMQFLCDLASNKLEFFPPASAAVREWISSHD